MDKYQDGGNISVDYEGIKQGIKQAESAGGKLMINPESTATGFYGQRFSEIKNTYKGTRKQFAKDTIAQNKYFENRFYKGLKESETTPLVEDADDLYNKYSKEIKDFDYSKEDIAVLSNFLGRKGARKYFGYVIRDGRKLEDVFPDKYGPGAKQANKTPTEYLEITRPFYKKKEMKLNAWEQGLKEKWEKENSPDFRDYQYGGIIEDNRGQWAHPGEITKINSNNITMKGVNYPVLGISDTGDKQLMKPGGEYHFDGKSVTEIPMAQNGEKLNKGFLEGLWDGIKMGVNPKNVFVTKDFNKEKDFDTAYTKARNKGEKQFMWNNKRYSTNMEGTPQEQLQWSGITDERLMGSNILRERIARNVSPHGYGHTKSAIKSILTDTPEIPIPDKDLKGKLFPSDSLQAIQKEKWMDDNPWTTEGWIPREVGERPAHQDALNLTMGLPQKYNSFSVSSYKPTISKNKNITYYSLNEDKIQNNILQNALNQDLKENESKQVHSIDNPNQTEQEGALGTYTISRGKDDRGDYISYYDINDYSPFKEYEPGKGKGGMVSPFGKPFEIYDRLYFKQYKDGKKKRMYYTDEELKDISIEDKNFDTLTLQKELYNRGFVPKNSYKNKMRIYHSYFGDFPEKDQKIFMKKMVDDYGEGGMDFVLDDQEKEKALSLIKKDELETILGYKNDRGWNHRRYKNDYDAYLKANMDRWKKEFEKDPEEKEKRIAYFKKEWEDEETKWNNNQKISDKDYIENYYKEYPSAISYLEPYMKVIFDGVLGEGTKKALRDYKESNKSYKLGGWMDKYK